MLMLIAGQIVIRFQKRQINRNQSDLQPGIGDRIAVSGFLRSTEDCFRSTQFRYFRIPQGYDIVQIRFGFSENFGGLLQLILTPLKALLILSLSNVLGSSRVYEKCS